MKVKKDKNEPILLIDNPQYIPLFFWNKTEEGLLGVIVLWP